MIIHIIHCSCNLAFEINLSTYLFSGCILAARFPCAYHSRRILAAMILICFTALVLASLPWILEALLVSFGRSMNSSFSIIALVILVAPGFRPLTTLVSRHLRRLQTHILYFPLLHRIPHVILLRLPTAHRCPQRCMFVSTHHAHLLSPWTLRHLSVIRSVL